MAKEHSGIAGGVNGPSFLKRSMNKVLPLLLATSIMGCLSEKQLQLKNKHADGIVKNLASQERQKAILDSLKAKAIHDPKYNQRYVIGEMPSDQETRTVAMNNNMFFADPHALLIMIDNPSLIKELNDLGYTTEQVAETEYAVKFQENIMDAKHTIEQWTKKHQHTKKIIVGDNVYEITYPTVEFKTDAYQLGCVSWNDPMANWSNLVGESSLWLAQQPWIDNGYQNVPVVGLDNIQSLQPLTGSNEAVFNNIDGGADLTKPEFVSRSIYGFNTAANTQTQSPDDHNVATLELGAGEMNSIATVGTAPWSKIRNIDAGGGGTLSSTAIYAGIDSINNQIAQAPNAGQVMNWSFSGVYNSIIQAKVATFISLTGGKGTIVVSSGNSGNNNINPLSQLSNTLTIGATNTQDENRGRRSGSNYGGGLSSPTHIFGMADGNNTGVPDVNFNFNQGNGTSYAAPIAAGQVSDYQKFFKNHSFAEIQEAFAETAFDLGNPGYDSLNGYGYLRGDKAIIYGSSMSMPKTIDAGNNPNYSFQFTPETINGATLLADTLRYPNGQPVPYTVNSGIYTYTITVNTNNGFVNGVNQCTYIVKAPNGCVISGQTRKITVSNVASLVPIKIGAFNTLVKNSDVVNTVEVLSEVNARDFVLERAGDNMHFEQIGASLAAAGNSSQAHSYTVTDHNVPNGVWYYRFKETDNDGKTTYTKMNRVTIVKKPTVEIYPNPATSIVNIKGGAKMAYVVNTLGQQVSKIVRNDNPNASMSIDVSTLPVGSYLIRMLMADNSQVTEKLQIQR